MKSFYPEQYNSLSKMMKLKKRKSLTFGLAVPVLNEVKTLKKTIDVIKSCGDLIDQVIIMDSGSSDGSVELCKKHGFAVINDTDTAENLGIKLLRGKGWNLWSSLFYVDTDLVAWIDSDLKNINKKFLLGIIGPMLSDDKIQFVKGYWCRRNDGGRVTEIMVRPFINLVFPELRDFIQPLSGEYGGRTEFLRKLNFYSGYSVEIAILLQARMILGDDEIAQSFLGNRFHSHQSPLSLGKMSSNILHTMLHLARGLERISYEDDILSKSLVGYYSKNGKDICTESSHISDEVLPSVNKLRNKKVNVIQLANGHRNRRIYAKNEGFN